MLDIEQAVEQKFPSFQQTKPWIKKPTLGFLRAITHEREVNDFLTTHQDLTGFEFIEQALEYFNFSYSVNHRDRKNIPATGRVVIVANHPLGALDGLSLLKMVGEIRRDVKILANDMLMNFSALESLMLPVDNLTKSTRKSSISRIVDALNNDEAIIVFPAGEVSRIRPSGVKDGKWNTGFLSFAKKTNSPILPIHVGAKNSPLFYSCSMVYKPLAGMMLAHEMFNKHYKTINMRVGEPIPYHKIDELTLGKAQKAKLLRRHLYRLAKKKNKKSLFETETTIDHPQERRAIKEELNKSELLGETTDGKKIYLYDFKAGCPVMSEIGRLRELTFRQVGEGTGKKRDIDRYDRDYRHLVLWDENDLEIAGAYRLGEVKNILNKDDSRGIYSEELFEYDREKMAPYFEQGIELGRSFVSPKYWGKRSLDYLWYGIGAYLKRYPEVRYLFGPVSLSNSYPELAKALIVSFYSHYFKDEQKLAKSRTPYIVPRQDKSIIKDIISGDDYEADFKKLRQQLAHMDVTVPTLYKQYSEVAEKGGVRFIDFNVDADFADCIDGLVMVDMDMLKPKKRARYLAESSTEA